MSGLENWAAGRLAVSVAAPDARERAWLCRLLEAAGIHCRAYADARGAVTAMQGGARGAGAPDLLVTALRAERDWLRLARARSPGLVIIGFSPLIRANDPGRFAPLRGLLGADYVLPSPVDGAELLAVLVLAASDISDSHALYRAS
ncbi:response regulator transcription factor [Thiohalocapsa halophila]|nr:response regulator transcription factor [Thiohalocapsa halophila]